MKKKIKTPQDAVEILGYYLSEMDREMVCVVNVWTDGSPINCNFVSIGAVDMTVSHPREMLKTSILSNAAHMLIIHNHPSGNLTPSVDDVQLTARMHKLCELVGIPLIDHIIVGGDNTRYFSFREKGILPRENLEYETDYQDINWERDDFPVQQGRKR